MLIEKHFVSAVWASDTLQWGGAGAQYIDPIKEPRPHEARSRTPGPPLPPKRPGRLGHWKSKLFYATFAIVVVGGTVLIFSWRGDTGNRTLSPDQTIATVYAEQTAESRDKQSDWPVQ